MTIGRKFKYLAIIAFFLFVFLGGLIAVDVHYHEKFLEFAGLNHRGYRGKVLGRKEKNEIRIAILGGSTAFGYGVRYDEAMPAKLEEALQEHCGDGKKITVINLAYNVEGAYAYYYNLEDFLYLDYDYVIFYSGYLDLSPGRRAVVRRSDPIFRTFGYMPILPLIAKEKIMVLRSGGRLDAAYRGEKIVFTPTRRDSVTIAVLENFVNAYDKIEERINEIKKMKNLPFDPEILKTDRWAWYKHFMKKSIDFALEKGKKPIVITPPFRNELHEEQQTAFKEGLDEKVFYVNMGNAISNEDEEFFFDGVHMTPKGCRVMADLITKEIASYIYKK